MPKDSGRLQETRPRKRRNLKWELVYVTVFFVTLAVVVGATPNAAVGLGICAGVTLLVWLGRRTYIARRSP
jgi:hypothetical protein